MNGKQTVIITYAPSTSEEVRTDSIIFLGAGNSKDSTFVVRLTQKRGRAFDFVPNTDFNPTIENTEGQMTFVFKANVSGWNATATSTNNWLKLADNSQSGGSGDSKTLRISYEKNIADTSRTATIKVKGVGPSKDSSFVVTITQERGRAFDFDAGKVFEYNFANNKVDTSFTFYSYIKAWNASATKNYSTWLSNNISPTSVTNGIGKKSIKINVPKNTLETPRTDTIIVRGANNSLSKDSIFRVAINQERGRAFEFSDNTQFTRTLPSAGTPSQSFTFTSNISKWKIESKPTWLTVTTTSSYTTTGSKTLTISAANYTGETAREGDIIIKGDNTLSGDSTFTIHVVQLRGNAFEFDPGTQFVYKDLSGDGGTIPFTFKYNIDSWQTKIGNNNDWLSVKEPYG